MPGSPIEATLQATLPDLMAKAYLPLAPKAYVAGFDVEPIKLLIQTCPDGQVFEPYSSLTTDRRLAV